MRNVADDAAWGVAVGDAMDLECSINRSSAGLVRTSIPHRAALQKRTQLRQRQSQHDILYISINKLCRCAFLFKACHPRVNGAEISKYYRRNDTADLKWEVDHEFDREDRYA